MNEYWKERNQESFIKGSSVYQKRGRGKCLSFYQSPRLSPEYNYNESSCYLKIKLALAISVCLQVLRIFPLNNISYQSPLFTSNCSHRLQALSVIPLVSHLASLISLLAPVTPYCIFYRISSLSLRLHHFVSLLKSPMVHFSAISI